MKLLGKINLVALAAVTLTSCLKSKNDIGGMLTDSGSIVTTIREPEYARQDNEHVIGFDYYAFTSFDFSAVPNEMVKFFTIHVSQPRDTKLSGPLRLKIAMTSIGGDPLPAGAITIPAEVEFPATTANSMDYNVKFAVNKAVLNPAGDYAAHFTITGTNQGAVGQIDNGVDVAFFNSKYAGRYMMDEYVTDPAGVIRMDKNQKPAFIDPVGFFGLPNPAGATNLAFRDEYYLALGGTNGYSTLVNNLTSGTTAAPYALIFPTYGLDANDNLIRVTNTTSGANYNVTLNGDATNKFVYTANDNRQFHTSFNVTLTAPLPGGLTSSRIFKVKQDFTFHPIQMRIF